MTYNRNVCQGAISMNGLTFIRQTLGLSGAAVARRLGVTRATVSDWEHGRRQIPSERLEMLSKTFSIPQQYFNELTEEQFEEVKIIIEINRQDDEQDYEFEEFKQATKELRAALQQINKNAQEKRSNLTLFSDYVSSIKSNAKLCLLFADVLKLYGTDSIIQDCLISLIQAKENESNSDNEITKAIRQEMLHKNDEMKKLSAGFDDLF